MPRSQATPIYFEDEDKGEPIRVVGGAYFGRTGWYWKGKKPTKSFVHVILKADEDYEEEEGKLLSKDSIGKPLSRPTNPVESIFQQFPNFEKDLKSLCNRFAKCGLDGTEAALQAKFLQTMAKASNRQHKKGAKATWHKVAFDGKQKK